MKSQQLYIPDRIKVGYKHRQDCYNDILGYVIYFDKKGVLRKQTSWEGWRDKTMDPNEYDNIPTDGFVLNKDVGGARRSYGWNVRIEKVRVFDPRGFEIEIDIANLLFILRECDCSRGKGLEGKFVYAWDGTELVLLPAGCEDAKNSAKFTTLQGQQVKAKELIRGATYLTKRQETRIYLGRFDYYFAVDEDLARKKSTGVEKRHVFWDGERLLHAKDVKAIAAVQSEVVVPNYADLVEQYNRSDHGSKVARLFLEEQPSENQRDYWYYEESPGVFVRCHEEWSNRHCYDLRFSVNDGILKTWHRYEQAQAERKENRPTYYGQTQHYYQKQSANYRVPTNHRLFAEMASGAIHKVEYYSFQRR